MNIVIKDKKTEQRVILPIPISEDLAEQFDKDGYVVVRAEWDEHQFLAEILSYTGLSVAELNILIEQLENMDVDEIQRYVVSAAAFLPHFMYIPEAFVILTRAIDYVQIFPDCTTYSQLGRFVSAADIQSDDALAAGIKTAAENIVGFYDGAAMMLTADDYEKAYSQFSDKFHSIGEIGSELV